MSFLWNSEKEIVPKNTRTWFLASSNHSTTHYLFFLSVFFLSLNIYPSLLSKIGDQRHSLHKWTEKTPNEPGKTQNNPADISVSSLLSLPGQPLCPPRWESPALKDFCTVPTTIRISVCLGLRQMPSSIHGINQCQCIFIFLKDFCGLSWNTRGMIKENPSPDAYTFLVLTLPPSTSAEPSERPHRDTISAAI